MLDYYSITPQTPKTLIETINMLKPSTREDAVNKAKVKSFLVNNGNQGPTVNIEYFRQQNSKIINSNGEFKMEDYFSKIHETFKEYHIPFYAKLYMAALTRIGRNQPILPLKALEEVKEETEEQKTI